MHHTIVCGMSVWGDNGNAVSDFVQKVRDHEASKLVNITEKPYTQAEIEILVGPLLIYIRSITGSASRLFSKK